MNSHEEYKQAFRQVLPSKEITMEDLEMNKKAYIRGKVLTIISAVTGCIVLTGGACYAANVGGIQETVNLWMRGSQVEATIEPSDDGFTVTYEDESGVHSFGGGGVALEDDGSQRPITMDEYLEYLNDNFAVTQDENGRIWVYAEDQAVDITDKFNICETSIEVNGRTIWVHVKKQEEGGFAYESNEVGPYQPVYAGYIDELFENFSKTYGIDIESLEPVQPEILEEATAVVNEVED